MRADPGDILFSQDPGSGTVWRAQKARNMTIGISIPVSLRGRDCVRAPGQNQPGAKIRNSATSPHSMKAMDQDSTVPNANGVKTSKETRPHFTKRSQVGAISDTVGLLGMAPPASDEPRPDLPHPLCRGTIGDEQNISGTYGDDVADADKHRKATLVDSQAARGIQSEHVPYGGVPSAVAPQDATQRIPGAEVRPPESGSHDDDVPRPLKDGPVDGHSLDATKDGRRDSSGRTFLLPGPGRVRAENRRPVPLQRLQHRSGPPDEDAAVLIDPPRTDQAAGNTDCRFFDEAFRDPNAGGHLRSAGSDVAEARIGGTGRDTQRQEPPVPPNGSRTAAQSGAKRVSTDDPVVRG